VRRTGHLFERVCAFPNLLLAARKAQAAKRYRPNVLEFNLRLEDNLHALRRELLDGSYRPGAHRHFQVHEPKTRWISAAPYRDRVVHHALCNVIEPVVDRRFIFDCWANRRGKGTHRAVLRYQRFAGRSRYALKMDVRKYFPSIDHAILKGQLRGLFKDPALLRLLDLIIDLGENPEPAPAYFPGDDLFTPWERRRGLPIGNLTSQLLANLYLDGFDHWVKERLGARGYLRFVDDFVLLDDSKGRLRDWAAAVRARLEGLRLRVHAAKCVIRRTDEGLPFLGYVVWPDRTRVRGQTVRRFRRKLRTRAVATPEGRRQSLEAWRGHVRLAGSYRRLAVGTPTVATGLKTNSGSGCGPPLKPRRPALSPPP
jgi:retron-type reverse transcriptase